VELSRVVVLSSRPVEGDTVNKLKQESNFITEKYTWMARAVYK
jgi:hypothetical protein